MFSKHVTLLSDHTQNTTAAQTTNVTSDPAPELDFFGTESRIQAKASTTSGGSKAKHVADEKPISKTPKKKGKKQTPVARSNSKREPTEHLTFVVWRGDNESNDADDSEEDDDEGEYNVFGKELHKASDGVHKGDAKKVATETEVRLLML
eukprot:1195313-Prorocentrum_minimum.AAC.9